MGNKRGEDKEADKDKIKNSKIFVWYVRCLTDLTPFKKEEVELDIKYVN